MENLLQKSPQTFTVFGVDICVEDADLASAISELERADRNFILAKYFLHYSNKELAKKFYISTRTATRWESRIILELKASIKKSL